MKAVNFARLAFAGILAIALTGGVTSTAFAGAKPANAGKNGTKSNAGAGNGAEAGDLIGTSVSKDTILLGPIVAVKDESTGVTTYLELPDTTETLVSKQQVGPAYQPTNPQGKPVGNTKALFEFTYEVTTWTGEAWETTYQTVQKQEVVRQDTTTSTYADIDPGNSGSHNQAPEASTVVETAVGPEYTEVVDLGPGDPIVEEGGGFESTTETVSEVRDHPCSGEGNGCSF